MEMLPNIMRGDGTWAGNDGPNRQTTPTCGYRTDAHWYCGNGGQGQDFTLGDVIMPARVSLVFI